MKLPFSHSRNDGTLQMSTLLIVRDERTFACPDQQARSAPLGVLERLGATQRHLVHFGNGNARRGDVPSPEETLESDPCLTDHERPARQYDELHQIAAGYVIVLFPIDGKITAPPRLLFERATIGRHRAMIIDWGAQRSVIHASPSPNVSSRMSWPIAGSYIAAVTDRKSTRLNSSHVKISYADFCLKKKKKEKMVSDDTTDAI